MWRQITFYCILFFYGFSLLGCASARKKDLETQRLRNQISALETQLQAKDEEINILKEDLVKARQERIVVAKAPAVNIRSEEVKSRPNVRQIQLALSNAGYNPGPIDGKMGKQTRQAIKAFQKAKGVASDGRVGKETWKLLREYLHKKIK